MSGGSVDMRLISYAFELVSHGSAITFIQTRSRHIEISGLHLTPRSGTSPLLTSTILQKSVTMSSTELKGDLITVGAPTDSDIQETSLGKIYTDEVFKKTDDGVDFRTVGWKRTSVIFMKLQFALGVLNIPSAIYVLGAVGGAFNVVGWGLLNTCKTPSYDMGIRFTHALSRWWLCPW